MLGNDFDKALADAGAALDRIAASKEVQRRLWDRLVRSRRSARAASHGTFRYRLAWGVALIAAFGLGVWLRPVLNPPMPLAQQRLGGLALAEASADLEVTVGPGDRVAVLGGRCRLMDQSTGMSLELGKSVELRREHSGVRLVAGRVEVSVAKQPAGRAVRLLVAHGAIDVTGTRFTAVQETDHGWATLHEGRIAFVAPDGRTVMLKPGESLAWPLPPVAPLPPASVEPSPPTAPSPERPPALSAPPAVHGAPPPDVPATLERIAVLRSRGEYGEAARVLRRALAAPLRAESAEILSYELGSILAHQLQDPAAACAHWERHLGQYPAGRFDREVEESRAALGCARGIR